MATVSTIQDSKADQSPEKGARVKKSRRRKTTHLKIVPETRDLRDRLREKCRNVALRLDRTLPLTKDEMEQVSRRLLTELGLPEGYVGWTMVVLASEFWRDQVAAVPPSRRLFLLPHCLKHAEGCPADYDEFGLECRQCGACSIADFRTQAEDMGYKVLVAEGSPIVLKIIVSGYVDAIVGVACLNVLEKAIDKILLAGIPCMAVPLLSSDCRNTSVDEDWVHQAVQMQKSSSTQATRSYVHLMRCASQLFEAEQLNTLAPRLRGQQTISDGSNQIEPVASTEAIAYDFLAKGGKHSRPFITLAVHDALTGSMATMSEGHDHLANLPNAVKRVAMSIETFHKASLVHDDIEDDDAFRYGEATIHRSYGVPMAINVGDYLIGFGYRLVSREVSALGADVAADILDRLADAHMRLSEGQGAELTWRDARDKRLKPIDALKIYALKTAPAFEAALYSGIRMAGPADKYLQPVKLFARNLGVAFQILNDLKDWEGDIDNKVNIGGDVLSGRPTILLSLALEALDEHSQGELLSVIAQNHMPSATRIERARRLFEQAGVFERAHRLIDKHQERAESIADEIDPDELRRLFYYLIDTVLERNTSEPVTVVMPTLPTPTELPASS